MNKRSRIVSPSSFNLCIVLRYFELENTSQEQWSDFAAALNQVPVEQKEEESAQNGQMAEYMAITFQETFADPLGINDEFYRKGGLVSGALQITSRQFSAEEFLLKVHSNTSFEKLNASIPMLEVKIQEKREAQRNLVKQNFERFVSAKATIDAVFLEMQSQGLTTGEFGLERCRDAVVVASNKVKELYAPLLESQQREAELRRKIAWVAKHKWLLESPQQLHEYRQVGDYGGFVKYAGDLVRQWKTYAERDSPMLENMQLFWEGSVMPQLKETHECLRDRLCKSSFSSAADAQIVIQQYDALTLILRQCTLYNMSYEDATGLNVYLKAQNERLIVEINKIFIAA